MKIIYIILLVSLISACSSSGKKAVDKLYYRFPQATISPIHRVNLSIKRPSAMGIIGNRPMVVQNSDGALTQMQNNFWLDSPKILLHNYLEKIFSANIEDGKNKLILYSQILHLEKKQETAILAIKFTLVDSANKLVLKQTYTNQIQLANNSIPAFAKAIAQLLETTIQQFIADIP